MTGASRPAAGGRLLLYAPNVHTGGGLVLLQALLKAWPEDQPLVAWLDDRARAALQLPAGSLNTWVHPSASSRLGAEISLAAAGKPGDRVLCFHGLPPLLRNAAKILLFQQNRNYLGQVNLANFALRTRVRLRLEQLVSRTFRRRVSAYWVQSPSMAKALRDWYGPGSVDIEILPFAVPLEARQSERERLFDFVYVADGEAHKNHRTLVEAWVRLKQRGLTPSLALTLSKRDTALKQWVALQAETYGLRISDLGVVSHAEIANLYSQASALVFPSLSESFGLPLIEARESGLTILAGELDFVRDVCEPAETFDPTSPVSLERAVLRFLGEAEKPQQVSSAAEFLAAVNAF